MIGQRVYWAFSEYYSFKYFGNIRMPYTKGAVRPFDNVLKLLVAQFKTNSSAFSIIIWKANIIILSYSNVEYFIFKCSTVERLRLQSAKIQIAWILQFCYAVSYTHLRAHET